MKEPTMRMLAGEEFKQSLYGHNIEPETWKYEAYRKVFIIGFIAGIKKYATHLFDKGSVFDIVSSIRETADFEEWAPILDFEKTVLNMFEERKQWTEEKEALKKKVDDWFKETTCRYKQAVKEQKKAEMALEEKEKELAELNKLLACLEKSGYQAYGGGRNKRRTGTE